MIAVTKSGFSYLCRGKFAISSTDLIALVGLGDRSLHAVVWMRLSWLSRKSLEGTILDSEMNNFPLEFSCQDRLSEGGGLIVCRLTLIVRLVKLDAPCHDVCLGTSACMLLFILIFFFNFN